MKNEEIYEEMDVEQGWYDYRAIDKKNCHYNFIIGERSNGKTYGFIKKCFTNYIKNGKHAVLIRRFDDQLMPKNISDLWRSFEVNNEVLKISKGKYNTIIYNRRKWYCAFYDSNLNEYTLRDDVPFMHAMALNTMENTKSGFSDPDVNIIGFDEVLTRQYYLKNEFVIFQNLLSTIIRNRDDVKIYMLANTVNFSSPYFREMGIENVRNQKQGTIEVYQYNDEKGNDTGLRLAMEYCASSKQKNKRGKKSDVYFAFNNSQIKMITSGSWEMSSYPHPDFRVSESKLIWNDAFIEFEDNLLQLEIYNDSKHGTFLVVHPFTKELKLKSTTFVYTLENNSLNNYRYGCCSRTNLDKLIWRLLDDNKWMYSDNTTGEIVNNFIKSL